MTAKPLKKILEEFLKGTEFSEINDTITIESLWKKTLGEPISKNTTILSFKHGTITAAVSTPAWRNELSLQKKQILEKLIKTKSGLRIKEIILR